MNLTPMDDAISLPGSSRTLDETSRGTSPAGDTPTPPPGVSEAAPTPEGRSTSFALAFVALVVGLFVVASLFGLQL